MPSLTSNTIQKILENFPSSAKFNIFIESGTYMGDTIREMEKHFKTLHTIELKRDYYNRCKNAYKGDKITFHLGDTVEILPSIIKGEPTKPTVFFLDGHWSGGTTARGPKDCPLVEELEIIGKHHQSYAIVIIDDYDLFGKGPSVDKKYNEDWTDITVDTVLSPVKNRVTEYYEKDSRLIVHLNMTF